MEIGHLHAESLASLKNFAAGIGFRMKQVFFWSSRRVNCLRTCNLASDFLPKYGNPCCPAKRRRQINFQELN